MRLTKRDVSDLRTLVDHVRNDMSYGPGGTYQEMECADPMNPDTDKAALRASERAIGLIRRFIERGTK